MDFSVVLPTRGNVAGLKKMLDAFVDTTTDLTNLEVLIATDWDDPDHDEIIKLCRTYPFYVLAIDTIQTDNFCQGYFNRLADLSSGKNILGMNDDCYMLTKGWDDIVRKATEGRDIYLVDMWDSTHDYGGQSIPRFPMISRKAVETVGFFFYPQISMWPADLDIYNVYRRVDAVIECHEVKLQHDHITEGDQSKSRLWQIFQEDIKKGLFPVNMNEETRKLKEAMMPCPVPAEGMPKPHKELLLGCGSRTIKDLSVGENKDFWGLVRLDNNADHKPDVVWDLTQHPLPFADEEFDEIHAYDVLEHLAQQGDYEFFFKEFSEYWRILKPGGAFCASVPAVNTAWAWGDPSHKRVIQPESLVFLSQKAYEEQVGKTKMSDFRGIYKVNFDLLYSQVQGDTFFFVLKKN